MKHNVLITGASGGIGHAVALLFAERGYNVAYCASRESEKAEKGYAKIRAICENSLFLPFDVKDAGAVAAACKRAREELGSIDALILCAGVAKQELFQYTSESDYDRIMDINVKGAFLTAKELLPDMIAKKSGSIVFVSSMWGQVGGSCEVVYSASKAALIGMTKALAKEVAPSGVRVNCICPGVIETDMTFPLGRDTLDSLAAETPLGRNGDPEDIAKAALFLCSDDASFITGQVIGINGGLVI